MGRPRQFDPERVVNEAMEHFWSHGYRDTSVDELVAATGVRPGSLYVAFPGGKHAIFLASLERYSKLVVPTKLGALEQPGASLAEVRAYFDGLVQDLLTPEGHRGCLLVNSAVELAADDDEVAVVVGKHMDRLRRNMTRALRNAKRRKEVGPHVDASAKATQLMATAVGLVVVGKTAPGKEVLETIVQTAFAGLE